MEKVANLKSLESALRRVLTVDGGASETIVDGGASETPQQKVFNGDALYQVVKYSGLSEDNKISRTNQNGRSAVQMKHGLMGVLADRLLSLGNRHYGVLPSPVRVHTSTFIIFSPMGLGYVNIFATGAMVTMMPQVQGQLEEFDVNGNSIDAFTSVSVQGVAEKIEDPDVLEEYFRRPEAFWNAQNPHMPYSGTGQRPELMMVLEDGPQILLDAPLGPFSDYGTRVVAAGVSFKKTRMDGWQFNFTGSNYIVTGIIHKHADGTVSLWASTKYDGDLNDSCLDQYFRTHRCKWCLFSMKIGIKSSDALDAYIKTKNWVDPTDALLVIPQGVGLQDWRNYRNDGIHPT